MRHNRLVQDWLAEGRQESRQEGEAAVTLRQLNRRCGPLSDATNAQIQALPLEKLEALTTWLAAANEVSNAPGLARVITRQFNVVVERDAEGFFVASVPSPLEAASTSSAIPRCRGALGLGP